MARNVEIKATLDSASLDQLQRRIEVISTDGPFELEQTDTFFAAQNGRLKLREFADASAELIFYQRPDAAGPKTSDYIRTDCPSPDTMKDSLRRALGISGVVTKRRSVFLVDQTRVHLDQVDGLGDFLELEVVLKDGDSVELGERIALDLMRTLQIDPSQLVSGAYFDLLQIKRQKQTANG